MLYLPPLPSTGGGGGGKRGKGEQPAAAGGGGGGLAAGGRLVDADEAMVLRLQAAREAMATASVTDGTDGVLFLE